MSREEEPRRRRRCLGEESRGREMGWGDRQMWGDGRQMEGVGGDAGMGGEHNLSDCVFGRGAHRT